MAAQKKKEAPAAVYRLWEWWKQVGRKFGDIQARILLTLFYFIVLSPFAIVVRSVSDPLGIKPGSPRGWRPKAEQGGDPLGRAKRQF